MTDIEKIRQEIERRMEACKTKNGFPAGTICAIRIETYEGLLSFIGSLPEEKPIEKDEKMEALIARDIMEATVKRVNIDKQDKDKEEEAMLEKINYLRNLGLNE